MPTTIDYQNRRLDYIAAFLAHLVNWGLCQPQPGWRGRPSAGCHRDKHPGAWRQHGSGLTCDRVNNRLENSPRRMIDCNDKPSVRRNRTICMDISNGANQA
jgi:hypothetical protein